MSRTGSWRKGELKVMSAGEVGAGLVPMSSETRRHAIKKEMTDLRLSQNELANKAGIGEKTLRRLLTGAGTTNESTFIAVEKALETMRARYATPRSAEAPVLPMPSEDDVSKTARPDHVVIQFEGMSGSSLEIQRVTVDAPADALDEALAAVHALFERARQEDAPRDTE